ncbi:hypothetical protein BS78_05G203200 [Paspalum vaginatum]|nr:hypothetical protein BS78_05G203200 [Paspalum vaginatum]
MGYPLSTAAAPEEQQKHRMSKADILWILAQKPMAPPARYAALKRSNPELTPRPGEEADEDRVGHYRVVKAFYEMEERIPRTQEWARGELLKKGYVELDEETVSRKAEAQAVIDREWPANEAKMKELVLSEKADRVGEGGSDESDDIDDEGEDDSDY